MDLEEVDVEVAGILNARIARGWVTLRKTVTPYMVFLLRLPMSLRLTLLSPSSLRTSIDSTCLKSNSLTQSSQAPMMKA